jgi:hypothetical protein
MDALHHLYAILLLAPNNLLNLLQTSTLNCIIHISPSEQPIQSCNMVFWGYDTASLGKWLLLHFEQVRCPQFRAFKVNEECQQGLCGGDG